MVGEDEQLIKLLAGAEFFVGLESGGLELVLKAAQRRRLDRHEVCFRQDEPATLLYLLTAGRIKLTQLTPDGRQVLLRFVEPGEVFGGIALFTREQYPVTAEAVEGCRLLAWDGPAMQRLIEAEPKIALNVIQHLAAPCEKPAGPGARLSTERVERRIARAILRLAAQAGQSAAGRTEGAQPAVIHRHPPRPGRVDRPPSTPSAGP